MRRFNISPESASSIKSRPLQPITSHGQDSSPCFLFGFFWLVRTSFCCERCPYSSSQASSHSTDGSQQMCWMRLCLPRTRWAATFPWHVMGPPLGKHLPQLGSPAPAKHQGLTDRRSRLWAIPPSHIGREERKFLFIKRNNQSQDFGEVPRSFCCSLH